MAAKQKSASKSKARQGKKNKHIGAKPLLNSGEAAPPVAEYNSPGIHTTYDAYGGHAAEDLTQTFKPSDWHFTDPQGKSISSRPNKSDVQEVVTRLREYVKLLERTKAGNKIGEYAKEEAMRIRPYLGQLCPVEVIEIAPGETTTRMKNYDPNFGNLSLLESRTLKLQRGCSKHIDNIGIVPAQESIEGFQGIAAELEKIWDLKAEGLLGQKNEPEAELPKQIGGKLPETKPPRQRKEDVPEQETSWPAKVISLLYEHRDWSVEKIAKAVGKTRSALYSNPDIQAAIKARNEGKRQGGSLPNGDKDPETGHVEAWRS